MSSGREALRVMRVLEAGYASAAQQTVVRIEGGPCSHSTGGAADSSRRMS
jgi:hypothetical protein